jgi:hypothetical protein
MCARTLALAFLACICLWGCQKEKSTDFEVTAIEKIDIRYTEIRPIPLSVAYNGGDKQTITLSVQGLPQGALASFTPNSNTPPFDTKMQLSTKGVKGGEYTLKLIAQPTEGQPRSYDVKMKVKGVEEIGCALELAGEYVGPVVALYTLDMRNPTVKPAPEKNRIIFTNCEPLGFYADLDCSAGSLNIPYQKSASGTYVTGGGIYTGAVISMSLRVEDEFGKVIRNQSFKIEKPITVY